MTARDMRIELDRLTVEHEQALHTAIGGNDFVMESLEADLAATRIAYVGFAVTEIASLRGQLFGRQFG